MTLFLPSFRHASLLPIGVGTLRLLATPRLLAGCHPSQLGKFYFKLRAENADYLCVSYTSIGRWIELCIKDCALFPRIRETLVQYRDYLGTRFPIPAFGDKYMNEIVDFISKGNFAAAQAVKDNLDTAIQKTVAGSGPVGKEAAAPDLQRVVGVESAAGAKRTANPTV